VFFQRGVYESARGPRVDSIAELFQGRRLLFFFIASAAILTAAAGYFLIDNGIISLPNGLSPASQQATRVQADPKQGLPIEVPLNKDVGLALYRNPTTRDKVVSFYTNLAGSAEIAQIVIKTANGLNVPLSLAFALAWKESKFEPTAVNYNGNSVDRGLYQLNSLSFPTVKPQEFFDPATNAEKGLGYLSQCLKDGGNEVVGLAMYNAGMSRVFQDGTPRVTLDYISTILKYQDAVITEFQSTLLKQKDLVRVVHTAGRL
jgi:hypothetical protein